MRGVRHPTCWPADLGSSAGGHPVGTQSATPDPAVPRLLIADEPATELDAAARAVVLARIFDVAAKGGSLVVADMTPRLPTGATGLSISGWPWADRGGSWPGSSPTSLPAPL